MNSARTVNKQRERLIFPERNYGVTPIKTVDAFKENGLSH